MKWMNSPSSAWCFSDSHVIVSTCHSQLESPENRWCPLSICLMRLVHNRKLFMIWEALHINEAFLQQQKAKHVSIKIFYFLSKFGLLNRMKAFHQDFLQDWPIRFPFLENFNHTDFLRLFSLNPMWVRMHEGIKDEILW